MRLPLAARFLVPVLLAVSALPAAAPVSAGLAAQAASTPRAPELPLLDATHWLNSPPLTLSALRGRPVLVEFWTFGCSNCRNTLPWLERTHARYAPQGLVIIAVHTPEFDGERDRDAVTSAVARLGIRYPVLIDNGYAYWRALDNQYWPAFYLIDPEGHIVDTRIGELLAGERRADRFEAAIADLLHARGAEAAGASSHRTAAR
jgi:thiol-disulfide isomerase/thioredoxin